jgi:hypothetical protein
MMSRPPVGIASRALAQRLTMDVSSCTASMLATHGVVAKFVFSAIASPSSRVSMGFSDVTNSLRSTFCG